MMAELWCRSWELASWIKSRRQRERMGYNMRSWNFKTHPQWHTSSSQATPPGPHQVAPPNGNHVFKCPSYAGHSHSNHQTLFHTLGLGLSELRSLRKRFIFVDFWHNLKLVDSQFILQETILGPPHNFLCRPQMEAECPTCSYRLCAPIQW